MVGRLASAVAAGRLTAPAASVSASAAHRTGGHATGVRSVTAITNVYTCGQNVAAVAVEYSAVVNPRALDLHTYTVSDGTYSFRFDPIEELGKRAVVQAECSTPPCYVKLSPKVPPGVVHNEEVYARPGHGVGRGKPLAAASPTADGLTGTTGNPYVDDFTLDTYTRAGMVLPYAYHLPPDYHPNHTYPMVVMLPAYGMGYHDENTGAQLAADIPAAAWLRPGLKGTNEHVIVPAPQNQRVGVPRRVPLNEDFITITHIMPRVVLSEMAHARPRHVCALSRR